MAVEFATSTASNIAGNLMVESLLKPAARKLRYMFCFDNIVKHHRKKRQELSSAQHRLQHDVEEARRQTQEIEHDVLDWLNNADEALRDMQRVEDEIRETKTSLMIYWCPNWSRRYKLSKKVAKKMLVADQLVRTREFDRLGHRAALPSIEFFSSSKDFLPSKSSSLVLNRIRNAMDNDDVNMIGVCGMGGVGKTTLVKIVGNKAKELKLFNQVVFVTVSQNPNLDRIQDEIADALSLEFDKRSEQGKARQLWLRLMMEKRVLIILDDVWKHLNLIDIGIPFGEYHKGCKIIVTTRRQQVFSAMRCQTKVQLDVLAEDESWELFKQNMLSPQGTICGPLNDVAREVASECKGLPLAIVTMARALRDRDLDEWIVTNQRLKNSRHLDNRDICEDIYTCLKLSYDYLKSEKLKSCFLSCSLFPEDYEISIEELTRYEVGRGMFTEVNLIEDARREIRVLVRNLQSSGLLLDIGKEQFVKMHDVVRDFAHWLTSSGDNTFMIKSGIGIKEWPRSENFGCYTTISLMNNHIHNLPNKLDCPKLQTLLFSGDGSTSVSTTFFEGMSNLKVLTVDSVDVWSEGLQFLTNLRTLHLEKCKLSNNISSLGKLRKLEILDFHGSDIRSLPNELGDLPCLRLLDLSDCQRLRRIPSNLLQRLSLLEELYFSGFSVQKWANEGTSSEASHASLSELNLLSNLTVLSLNVCSKYFPRGFSFSKLERYGIFINRWYYGSYPTSRTLQIKKCRLEAFKELFFNVEHLVLDGIIGYKNVIPISDEGGLNKLISLELQDCKDIECLIDTSQHDAVPVIAFSNLVKLTMMGMVSLKELCNGPHPNSFLQTLEEMTVRKCGHMISIVPALQNLKQVKVKDCDKLQVVFQIDGINLFREEDNSMQLLSKLTYLELELLPELRNLWRGSIRHVSFQSLKVVRIQDCNKLTFLLSLRLAQTLVHLEKLEISHCSRLERLINDIADEAEILQNITDHPSILCFPRLTTLRITDCSRLTYIFPMWTVVQSSRCDGNEIVLPQLQSLVLENLVNLRSFYAENSLVTLPCLEKLQVHKCPNLTHFTVGVQVTEQSQLKRLCLSKVGKSCNIVGPHWQQNSRNSEEFFAIGDGEEILQLQGGHFLSSLEALRLEAFSDMQVIWKGPTINVANLQNLVCLVLMDCQKLRYVFPQKLAQNLKQLSYLDIQECGELEHIIIKDQASSSSSQDGLQPLCFPNLTEVCIRRCQKLKSLFPISVASHLPKLDSIIVEDVFGLEQVFAHEDVAAASINHEEILLLQLRELLLSKLPNVMSFGPIDRHFKFPFLGFLTVTDCPNIVSTFTVDSQLTVHAKAEIRNLCVAKESNGTRTNSSSSNSDIDWRRHECPNALPPFTEEP